LRVASVGQFPVEEKKQNKEKWSENPFNSCCEKRFNLVADLKKQRVALARAE